MSTKYNLVQNEIRRFTELTRSGKLQWEKVHANICTYQTCDLDELLIVSCCGNGCYIQIQNVKYDVPCELLFELCSEIVNQIKNNTTQMSALAKSLHALTSAS
jgi:transcriptional regulator CtsR